MPKKKDLKRLARARMQKTGESYTAARAQLIRKKRTADAAPAPAPDYAALAGTRDAAVQAKTGRTWAEWVAVLDAAGAAKWPHRDIAEHVYRTCDVTGWWAQTVTVGYERIRGLRETGQRRDGTHEVSKSRTVPVPVEALYRACSDARRRRRWLPDVKVTVRKGTPPKSIRMRWPDDTPVELYFTAKGPEKSQVTVQHRGLASRADADRMRAFWAERVGALAALLVP